MGLAEEITQSNPNCRIICTYRNPDKYNGLKKLSEKNSKIEAWQLDPLDESKLDLFFKSIEMKKIDLLVNSIGILDSGEKGPEKSLRDISVETMNNVFRVNSFISPLLAKYSKSYFSKQEPSVFCALSAMVGSIQDNKLGGWYSYRASKTALNMFIKTIAIEFERYNLETRVLAIHPGTTETDLSRNYLKSVKHKIWTANESARHIIDTIEKSSTEGTGLFKNWNNEEIPW